MNIILSDNLLNKLEYEGIRLEDVQKVIEHAERFDEKIINTKKETFTAYLALGTLTLWVEYLLADNGFLVNSFYYHRIQIEENTNNGREKTR